MEVLNETLPFIQWNPDSNSNEVLEAAHKNMGEVHKCNVDPKKTPTKEHIAHDSIYINYKNNKK